MIGDRRSPGTVIAAFRPSPGFGANTPSSISRQLVAVEPSPVSGAPFGVMVTWGGCPAAQDAGVFGAAVLGRSTEVADGPVGNTVGRLVGSEVGGGAATVGDVGGFATVGLAGGFATAGAGGCTTVGLCSGGTTVGVLGLAGFDAAGDEHVTVNSTVAVPLAAGRSDEAEQVKLAVKWPDRAPARP